MHRQVWADDPIVGTDAKTILDRHWVPTANTSPDATNNEIIDNSQIDSDLNGISSGCRVVVASLRGLSAKTTETMRAKFQVARELLLRGKAIAFGGSFVLAVFAALTEANIKKML